MFKFIRKHGLVLAIVAIIACGLVSYLKFKEFFNHEFESTRGKNMKLFVAIAFGILALINLVKLIWGMKKKKLNRITER